MLKTTPRFSPWRSKTGAYSSIGRGCGRVYVAGKLLYGDVVIRPMKSESDKHLLAQIDFWHGTDDCKAAPSSRA
jgi:hypothetical protein